MAIDADDHVRDDIVRTLATLTATHEHLLDPFAAALLRRIPRDELEATDSDAIAGWLATAFEALVRHRPGDVDVRVHREPGGGDPILAADVLCDDRPFLLSTIDDELAETAPGNRRTWHAVIGVRVGDDGRVAEIVPARAADARLWVFHTEIARAGDVDADMLQSRLETNVRDVIRATDDFRAMHDRLTESAAELRFGAWSAPSAGDQSTDPHDDPGEIADLIDWLLDDNLVLLGIRDYIVDHHDGESFVRVDPGSGLGLLADASTSRFAQPVPRDELPPAVADRFEDAPLLTVTRTTRMSTVQRRERMQYLGLTRRDDEGRIIGERRILGLFTRKGLAEPVHTTPVLRAKLREILRREDLVDGSYDEIELTSLFQALPKDEAFAATTDQLHALLLELQQAAAAADVRTLLRVDPHTRLASVVVTVPRERYSPQLRRRIEALLHETFDAERITVEVSLGDRPNALARFLVHLRHATHDVSATDLERRIRALTRTWADHVDAQLGDDNEHLRRLAARMPTAYRESTEPDAAIGDLLLLAALDDGGDDLRVELRTTTATPALRVRVAKRGEAVELSGFIPILESLGLSVLEEVPHRVADGDDVRYLHDFGIRAIGIDPADDSARVADAIIACWQGRLAIDGLNAVVVTAGLDWHAVRMLRAYRRLRRQLGTTFTSEYVNRTFVNQPAVARALVDCFHARFDPARDDAAASAAYARAVEVCNGLDRLDDDRILRGTLELIHATVRTNAFRDDAVDDRGVPYLSLKLDPSRLDVHDASPAFREIFVHAPDVEGVHLRYGPVARGGLRWSDRLDDVRNEVVDLAQAQVRKNAIIVPTGAKGGFVLTAPPDDPAQRRDAVARQYVTFVRGLLDVTDNVVDGAVVTPAQVRRHDEADPYLVVAADRGTATFSDTANELAQRYDFWLSDAFASGGSNGYDHKRLGVTARGAWLAVRRHFLELGIDVQSEPVRVTGVGDMSGDVFGNGLLQSRSALLVAAFDHRDIFLDPDPDAQRAYAERERLFALPRSSWQDYDRDALGPGGGIYSRTARSITVTEAAAELLGLDHPTCTPPELIRAILRASVDLLFAGGIGTYVKASSERNADVGDRVNDELRVDASDVRARVIGEGANLFVTPRGRVEFARRGGRINQDAVDNAAGVATSDLEVNTKILLNVAADAGRLDRAERDAVLAELTDEAVEVVMGTVDRQAAGISRETTRSTERLDAYERFLADLEASHGLDRIHEVLPDTGAFAERDDAGAGLTRPEVASLVAWAKRTLKEALLDSAVVDLEVVADAAKMSFPPTAMQRFGDLLGRHQLRRELVATALANEVVDRLGVTYVGELARRHAVGTADVVLAAHIASLIVDAPALWRPIDGAISTHDPARVRDLEATLEQTIAALTSSIVVHPRLAEDADAFATHLRGIASELRGSLLRLGTPHQRQARAAHLQWLRDDLVDDELAQFIAVCRDLTLVVEVGDAVATLADGWSVSDVATVFLRFGDELGIEALEDRLARIRPPTLWGARQWDGIAADLRDARRDAAITALRQHSGEPLDTAVTAFLASRAERLRRARLLLEVADPSTAQSLDAVAVATRAISAVVHPDRHPA